MTTYVSTDLTAGAVTPMKSAGLSGGVYCAMSTVAVPSTFTTTDTASMHYLPPGAVVLYSILKADDLDSSTGITLNVGDSGSATRYFSASAVAQAATSGVSTAVTGIGYSNSAKTLVSIVPQAGASGTPAAGNITLIQLYIIEPVAS